MRHLLNDEQQDIMRQIQEAKNLPERIRQIQRALNMVGVKDACKATTETIQPKPDER